MRDRNVILASLEGEKVAPAGCCRGIVDEVPGDLHLLRVDVHEERDFLAHGQVLTGLERAELNDPTLLCAQRERIRTADAARRSPKGAILSR